MTWSISIRSSRKNFRDVKGIGVASLFVVGSTVALTTLEFETGLVKHDVPNVLQRLVPDDSRYEHEATWNDDNGHSHIRAALIGPSVTVPFENGRLLTGEYQQVVLIDFDTRPRRRHGDCYDFAVSCDAAASEQQTNSSGFEFFFVFLRVFATSR